MGVGMSSSLRAPPVFVNLIHNAESVAQFGTHGAESHELQSMWKESVMILDAPLSTQTPNSGPPDHEASRLTTLLTRLVSHAIFLSYARLYTFLVFFSPFSAHIHQFTV
jgi:hypothetical protein